MGWLRAILEALGEMVVALVADDYEGAGR